MRSINGSIGSIDALPRPPPVLVASDARSPSARPPPIPTPIIQLMIYRPPNPTPNRRKHQRKEREFRARLDSVARLYGLAAAMRLKTEKEVLSAQAQRLPGLPASRVGLETVLGTDETLDFEDILNGRCAWGGVDSHELGGWLVG